jgi:DNA-binding PadR family transcriptional regulator
MAKGDVQQGTLYPVLLKLEQEGAIASERGTSENNRRARFYRLTAAGAAGSAWRRRTGSRQRPLWIASSW